MVTESIGLVNGKNACAYDATGHSDGEAAHLHLLFRILCVTLGLSSLMAHIRSCNLIPWLE